MVVPAHGGLVMSRGKKRLRRLLDDEVAAGDLANTGKRLVGLRSAEGDAARLRGIPVQGARGVSGTMRGTRPDGWIDQIPDEDTAA